MLPASFIVIAILLRFLAGASYFRATWQGRAQPNLVSWSFWSITALIAFVIQLTNGAGPSAFITLAIGLSPIAVCIAALYKRTCVTTLGRLDKWCIVLTSGGILLWVVSKDPLTMLYMSMVADFFSNLPTIKKAYRMPHTEHAAAYGLSVLSMTVALLTASNWQLTTWLFSAYILCINLIIVLSITVFSKFSFIWPIRQRMNAYEESGS